MSSYHVKFQIPSDIQRDNQYIPAENLKSQSHLDSINKWTVKNKMLINQKKTKTILFNFTKNHQFSTRLNLNQENVEVVSETKLLGTIIQNNLTWDSNTTNIVKKANARMIILRKLSEYGAQQSELKTIYISYITSILEQSAVVWHSSLTEQNSQDLTRVQKSACKIILRKSYVSYKKALLDLDLEDLADRRKQLCKVFAEKSANNDTIDFEINNKEHLMQLRNPEQYKVSHFRTERFHKSAIPYMQRLLNHKDSPC